MCVTSQKHTAPKMSTTPGTYNRQVMSKVDWSDWCFLAPGTAGLQEYYQDVLLTYCHLLRESVKTTVLQCTYRASQCNTTEFIPPGLQHLEKANLNPAEHKIWDILQLWAGTTAVGQW